MEQDDEMERLLIQPENSAVAQPHQPQKCPRCESMNTKFCYYNNYSLSQPRYFCKTCRRYWTQGGALRNIPVGGGCRKGKRTTQPSSSSSSSSSPLSHLTGDTTSSRAQPSPLSSPVPQPLLQDLPGAIPFFYSSGGILSSVSRPLQQPVLSGGGGGQYGGASNLGLFQGLNIPSFMPQQAIEPLFPSSRPNDNDDTWTQNFIDTDTTAPADFWGSTSSNTNAEGTSSNPKQWPDFSDYGSTP